MSLELYAQFLVSNKFEQKLQVTSKLVADQLLLAWAANFSAKCAAALAFCPTMRLMSLYYAILCRSFDEMMS